MPESPGSDSDSSRLSSRVEALEALTQELKHPRSNPLVKVGVWLGVFATVLAIASGVLALKSSLFPRPNTTLKEPSLSMQYDPPTKGLTFRLTVVADNDGDKEEIFSSPAAILQTAAGQQLKPAALVLDPVGTTFVVNGRTTLVLNASPTFQYAEMDGSADSPAKSLQVSFHSDQGKETKVQLCFALGPDDLSQAAKGTGYGPLMSDCKKQ
jgi:hypothetical protein